MQLKYNYIQKLFLQSRSTSGAPVASVASSVYSVITAVISRLNTHCSTDPPQEYALNSTAVIFHLKNTYSVIQYNYTVIISRDHT